MEHDCKIELKDAELKATPARLAVLEILEATQKPLDTSMLIASLKKQGIVIDQGTIFRIVNVLTEKGIVRQVQLGEGKFRYETASKPEHHHLVCEQCENIEDISDCAISDLEQDIRAKKGFIVKHHSLEFFGVCKQCQH